MSALSSDFYPPSNRRRCVKGRPSYTEPSDNILLSQAVNHDYSSNDSYSQNEYSVTDAVQHEDVEEEPITIDLSAFLNENPLLAQSAFESSAENNVASTESSSQFRVTDCEAKHSDVHKPSAIDEGCSVDVINNAGVNSVTNENVEALAVKDIVPPVGTVKENCVTPEEIFVNVGGVNHEKTIGPEKTFINVNGVSSKDIMLNGKKTPIKKFTKAKPLGLSNPLKKYKNFMKSKDLNKTNENVFGKYPVVRCEKLDIENFVKNNKIKVCNWPIHRADSPKSNKTKSPTNKRLGLGKVSLKPKLMGPLQPKLMRKSITFNKYLNSLSKKSNNNFRGMFDSLDPVSKPVIIRTNSWKPEITSSSAHIPSFFKNLIKPTHVNPKSVIGDLVKFKRLNDQTVNYNSFTSPEKEIIEKVKGPIIANVNTFCKSTKNYQRIAPKPIILSPDVANISPNLPKPVIDTLTEPVSNEYTVIEPYIEDPSSPQKPNPILTVPIEVISSPEKQNIILQSSAITKAENSEKAIKTVKSVFLNGAVKQISTPARIKKDVSVRGSIPFIRKGISKRKVPQKVILEQTAVKTSVRDELCEEDTNVLQAKNAVVDAMQSALGQNVKKTKPKIVKKEPSDLTSDLSMLGSSYNSILGSSSYNSAYNSILNDFIIGGFNDFEESVDIGGDENDGALSAVLTSPEPSLKARKVESTVKSNKRLSKKHSKRKKYSKHSPHTSDTLSASECEDEKNSEKMLKENFSLKRRKLISSSENVLGSVNSKTSPESPKKPRKLDTPDHISVNSSPPTNLNSESNKNFDSNHGELSHSFSHSENTVVSVSHVNSKIDTHTSIDSNKQPDIPNSALNETLSDNNENPVLNKTSKENDNLSKKEICTRTLRERKCSSTEVDKLSDNSSKQTQNNRHSFEKTKSVKGSINSKLKIQKKTPPRSTAKVKIKRKSCKSEDIIREINTITGGRLNLKKGFKNSMESDLENNIQNSDLSIKSNKDDSESNSSSALFRWNRFSARAFSKKKRTLKVRIKRSQKESGASCVQMPLSSLPDVIENANIASSVLENNISLHSSFREGEGEKMGTPCKEENSSENSASISETKMEITETDTKCSTLDEHLPAYTHEQLMVNSSETSCIQDVSSIAKSDVSSAVCDSRMNESLNDKCNLSNTTMSEHFPDIEKENDKSDNSEKSYDLSEDDYQSESSKGDENYKNMLEEKSVSVMPENCVSDTCSEASKDNYKDESVRCEADRNVYPHVPSESNIVLTQNDNSEDDMDIVDSSKITKNIIENANSMNISDVVLDDISKQDYNTLGVVEENISENVTEKAEDITKLKSEIIKDIVEEEDMESVPEVNVDDISVQESISSSGKKTETDQLSSAETHEIINEESNVESVTERVNEMLDSDSDKNCNNHQADLCLDDKHEDMKLPYSEIPDSEQNIILSQRNIAVVNEGSDSSVEPKKCPKIKISFVKNSGDSPDSLKNWFVSESKQPDESSHPLPDTKVPNVSSVDSFSSSIIDMNDDLGLNVNSDSSQGIESSSEVIPSDTSITVDKTIYGVTDISFSNDKSLTDYKMASIELAVDKGDSQLTDINKTVAKLKPMDSSLSDTTAFHSNGSSEKDISDEKISSTLFDDDPLIDLSDTSIKDLPTEKIDCSFFDNPLSDINDISDKDIPVEKVSSSFSDDNPLADIDKILSKDMSSKKIGTSLCDDSLTDEILSKDTSKGIVPDVVPLVHVKEEPVDDDIVHIKEEPVDDEIDIKEESSLTNEEVKTFNSQLVVEASKRKRGRPRTVSANKVLRTNVNSSDSASQVSGSPETPKSKGQKKKVTPLLTSTPSTGRKKNYDIELVRVPFSMGWMREHVIRATSGKDDKRPSDIYYFTPDGTKLRSMPEIGTYLSKHPDIKLSSKNFTFAKELIYREPFEIERDARQTIKKVAVPTKKKTSLKSPGRAVDPPESTKRFPITSTSSDNKNKDKSLSENVSPPIDSKKKVVAKRKSSLSKDSEIGPDRKKESPSDSKISRNPKQKTLDDYLDSDTAVSKNSARSSRKVVKKVQFDNSFGNKVAKKPKPTEQRNSSDKIKRNSKNASNEKDSRSDEDIAKNNNSNRTSSLIVHFPKVFNKSEHLGKQVIDSSPFTVTKSNELILNKPTPTTSTMNISDQLHPVRTSNKSSKIQNRLKVKLAPRKYELVLHKPCTKFCNFAYSREPSVKCSICLCLFHPECIPFKPTGDVKYACVPCVKTQIDGLEKEQTDVSLDPAIDTEILYPTVSLHIVPNPAFDATFNKFYSPVDQSFVQSCEENNGQRLQACGLKNIPYSHNVPNYCIIDKDSYNSLYQYSTRPKTNLLYPPMCYDRTGMTTPTGMRIVTATVPVQRNAASNPKTMHGDSGTASLQSFQNSYVQRELGNRSFLGPQISFQNTFCQRFNCDKLNSGSALDHFRTHLQMSEMTPFSSKQFHMSEILSNSVLREADSNNVPQNFGFPSNISLLQSMLQTKNQSFEDSCRNNVCTVPEIRDDLSSTDTAKKLRLDEVSSAANASQTDSNNLLPQHPGSKIEGMACEFLTQSRNSMCNNEINAVHGIASRSHDKNGNSGDNYSEGYKRKNESLEDSGFKKHAKKPKYAKSSKHKISIEVSNCMNDKVKKTGVSENFATSWNINKFSQSYECMNLIFKFLNVCDLLRVSLVCQSWKHFASQKLLWENVSFAGIAVKDWSKCCHTLQKYETKNIDFRGIHEQDFITAWESFAEHLHLLGGVEELVFEKVPPFVINKIADVLPQLKKLTCYCLTSVFTEPEIWSTPCEFKLSTLRYLGRLQALKISSMGGIILKDEQQSLMPYLPNLTHVVLTGFKFNSHMNLECLSQQKQLITLELGDCIDIEPQIYGLLSKLISLQNLCLQNGGSINDSKLAGALSKMKRLRNLEIMNFQISCHLSNVLKKMTTLQHFSIWPDNRSEAAQVNFNSYCAAMSCSNLKSICWGILSDDDDTLPNALELQDTSRAGSKVEKLSFQELFQALVKYYPGVKVEVKCLPRSIWSEFCSSRNFT